MRLALDDRVGPVWRLQSSSPAPPPSRETIVKAAEALGNHTGALLLEGRELLKRSDLLGVLDDLARIRPDRLGICTAGEGLTAAAAQLLEDAGVRRAQVPVCCARQDANDWLMNKPGALKMAGRTIRAFVEADIPVTAEVVVTRPTMRHLAETVEILARLGVRSLIIRRLTQDDVDGPEFVPLSPRIDLLGEHLEQAAAVALERRMTLKLRDFPVCTAPRLRPLFAPAESEVWIATDGSTLERSPRAAGCPTCPGDSHCGGAPIDYIARFGWEEFADPGDIEARVRENVEEQQALSVTAPMVFAWRSPRRVRCGACAEGLPLGEAVDGAPAHEPTRAIRSRLVEAARYRPQVFRLVGADLLAHPEAAQLLYDAVRLFPKVEVAGEASAVVDWSDLDLRRIRDLSRFDAVLYGPDATSHDAHCGIPGAFAATMRAIERLGEAGMTVGAYAILHNAEAVSDYAAAWSDGTLPGEPRIRLSTDGGDLDELAKAAESLSAGPFKEALLAVLPRCPEDGGPNPAPSAPETSVRQQSIKCGRSVPYQPCGSDPVGAFDACREGNSGCVVSGCPGMAVGWQSTARSKQWTVNT